MAWFRRNKNDDDPAPSAPEGVSPTDTVDGENDADVIRQERPSTGDWMAMPAMPTNGPIQPTFRVQTLPDILSSHHSPAVSGSLGHAVSADAPSGTVSGLALYSGARSSSGAAGGFTLRTPHPPAHNEELAPVARPLATVASVALPISTLPEPAVSRLASNPLPLASPVTAGRDVPVARVVDAAAAHAGAPIVSTAPTSPAVAPTGGTTPVSPETPDLRVGGFDLSALDPVADASDAELLTSRPPDLAPPIQPRALQRRTSGARPIDVAPHLLTPSTDATPVPDRVASAIDLPLHAPSTGGAGASGEAPPFAAVQRRADDDTSESSGDSIADVIDGPSVEGDAPLVGQRSVVDATSASDRAEVGSPPETSGGDAVSLPLVAPRSVDATASGPEGAHDVDRDEPADEITVSTLGVLAPSSSAGPLTSTGESTRTQIGTPTGALPLAPADWQESLDAPAGRTPTTSTVQRQSEGRPDASPAAPSGALRSPMTLASSRPVGAGASLASLATLAPSTTSVAQRMAAAAAAPGARAATSLAGSVTSTTAGSQGSNALSTTLARPGGATAAPATTGPSVALRASDVEGQLPEMITADTLLATQRDVPIADATSASSPEMTGASDPGFTLQRSTGTTGASPSTAPIGSGSSGATPMPLHTPATAIPSAAEIAVSAGLAERGPDGSIRYPHVPISAEPSVQREFVVQRAAGSAADASASGTPAPLSVQLATADSPPPAPSSGQGPASDLADQARKLYPHIRTQLESDIRRQLEARNRANRPT